MLSASEVRIWLVDSFPSDPDSFLGRRLGDDSVSPQMNTIASRDQFMPIRIGENLVVNYHA